MKEKILETLDDLGFRLNKLDALGYSFEFEGLNYLLIDDEEDENYIRLSVPSFYDRSEDNQAVCAAITERLNSSLKYVKVYEVSNSISIFYEHALFGGENYEALLEHMVACLYSAFIFATKTIAELEHAADGTETNGEGDED